MLKNLSIKLKKARKNEVSGENLKPKTDCFDSKNPKFFITVYDKRCPQHSGYSVLALGKGNPRLEYWLR
jgi:hypothetical protein